MIGDGKLLLLEELEARYKMADAALENDNVELADVHVAVARSIQIENRERIELAQTSLKKFTQDDQDSGFENASDTFVEHGYSHDFTENAEWWELALATINY